ncbi:MAG: FKBP-type peptidyl-prolyl cis-trans isomerase [Bdellovibrionaceae bacterium]|nr:FKBP-type peptidyl-prolyl cis-trans isomerase [Pseudobdellovibrionaceae bacterium]
MNKWILICILSFFMISCEKIKSLWTKPPAKLETEEEKRSYMIGHSISTTFKKENTIVFSAFRQGLEDGLQDKKPILSPEDIQRLIKQQQINRGESNKMMGQEFLEKNKTKEGVKVTKSGLQYEILAEGKGKTPAETDTVEVHYRGTLIDGTEFDSSYKRNSSISFPLGQVIKGWIEGLQLMKEGAKYKFYIPSELAYGAEGSGESIPPHSTLIFEVELLKVK